MRDALRYRAARMIVAEGIYDVRSLMRLLPRNSYRDYHGQILPLRQFAEYRHEIAAEQRNGKAYTTRAADKKYREGMLARSVEKELLFRQSEDAFERGLLPKSYLRNKNALPINR